MNTNRSTLDVVLYRNIIEMFNGIIFLNVFSDPITIYHNRIEDNNHSSCTDRSTCCDGNVITHPGKPRRR